MAAEWSADELVPLRSENLDRFKRSYLRQAVCELRFPTLMSLGEAKPPAAFVTALRKQYPTLELSNQVTVNLGASTESSYSHVLRSANSHWTVTLKASAVVLEAQRYTGFPEFKQRVLEMVAAAKGVIDSDFFTRLGLRYINVVASSGQPLSELINPVLVGPLAGQGFSGVLEFAGRLLLSRDDGGCLLQHGLRHAPEISSPVPAGYVPDYVLDIDAYRNDVQLNHVEDALDATHIQGFSMFDWALGPRARAYLSGVHSL